MTPAGARITREKRIALANCTGLLMRASDELDRMLRRGSTSGLDLEEVEDLCPLAQRVAQLRERRARLLDELYAVTTEWSEA